MAPEYAMHGYLTDKADVYSFGVVALEVVSGRSNTIYRSKDEVLYLLDWVTLCLSPLVMLFWLSYLHLFCAILASLFSFLLTPLCEIS